MLRSVQDNRPTLGVVTRPGEIGHGAMQRIVKHALERCSDAEAQPTVRRVVAPVSHPLEEPDLELWETPLALGGFASGRRLSKAEALLKRCTYLWHKPHATVMAANIRRAAAAESFLPKYDPKHTKSPKPGRRRHGKRAPAPPRSPNAGLSALGPRIHSDLRAILEQEKQAKREKMKKKMLAEAHKKKMMVAQQQLPSRAMSPCAQDTDRPNGSSSRSTSPKKPEAPQSPGTSQRLRRKKAIVPLCVEPRLDRSIKNASEWRQYVGIRYRKESTRGADELHNILPGSRLSETPAVPSSASLIHPASPSIVEGRAGASASPTGRRLLTSFSKESEESLRSTVTATTISTMGMSAAAMLRALKWKERLKAGSGVVSPVPRPQPKKSFASIRKSHPRTTNVHTPFYQDQMQVAADLHLATGLDVGCLQRALVVPEDILKPVVYRKRPIKIYNRVQVDKALLPKVSAAPVVAAAPPKRRRLTRPWVSAAAARRQLGQKSSYDLRTTASPHKCSTYTETLKQKENEVLKLNIARVCSKDWDIKMQPYSAYWLDGIVDREKARKAKTGMQKELL